MWTLELAIWGLRILGELGAGWLLAGWLGGRRLLGGLGGGGSSWLLGGGGSGGGLLGQLVGHGNSGLLDRHRHNGLLHLVGNGHGRLGHYHGGWGWWLWSGSGRNGVGLDLLLGLVFVLVFVLMLVVVAMVVLVTLVLQLGVGRGNHWGRVLNKVHGDGSGSGQDIHGRSRDVVGGRGALLEDEGEDLTRWTVGRQLVAVDTGANKILGVAVVARPADSDLVAGALQLVVQAGLANGQQAQKGQGEDCKEPNS